MKVKLSTKDLLAMYRCAFYSAMGVRNEETKPTDRQCIEWLQYVLAQAKHTVDPPLMLAANAPQVGEPSNTLKVPVTVIRFDAYIPLPNWRVLPR